MKKISLVLLMIMFSFTTFAQVEKEYKDEGQMEHKKKMHHDDEDSSAYSDKMAMKLSLNAEQKADIKKGWKK